MRNRTALSLPVILSLLVVLAFAQACRENGESDLGVRKPLPTPPSATPAAGTTSTVAVGAVTTPSATVPTTPTAIVEPPQIAPEAAQVLERMNATFADWQARDVRTSAKLVMISSEKGFITQLTAHIQVQFPDRFRIEGKGMTSTNDPSTTATWQSGVTQWKVICDGKKMFMESGNRKNEAEAPESIDALPREMFSIDGWGASALITSYLRTEPAEEFMTNLRRAEVVERTTDTIVLELVTGPTQYLQTRSMVDPATEIVHRLAVDAETAMPRSTRVDLMDLSREIYQARLGREVAIEDAYLLVEATQVDRNPDFADDLFTIPGNSEPALTPAPAP